MPSVSAASPPLVTSAPLSGTTATTLTTALFDAPASSVVVAMVSRDGATTEAPTYATNGTALAWEVVGLRNQSDGAGSGWVNASAGMAFARITTARTDMTVTASYATAAANQMALQVYLLTDVDMTDPLGGFLEGSDAAVSNLTTDPFTVEQTGSLMVAVLSGGKVSGQPNLNGAVPSSSDLTETAWNVNNELFGLQGYKTLGAAGSPANTTGASPLNVSANWNWVIAEFKSPVSAVVRAVTSTTDTTTTASYTMTQGETRAASSETGTATTGTVATVGHTAAGTSTTGTGTTGAVTSVAHTAAAAPETGTVTTSDVTVAHFAEAVAPTGTVTTGTFVRDTVALPSTGPLFFDFWVVDRATNTLSAPLPDYRSASVVPVFGEPGAVELTYPTNGLNYALLRDGVTHERDLEVEVWVGGRRDAAMRAILMQSNVDLVAEQGVHKFAGHFLPILLDEMVVLPDATNPKQETRFVAATAGAIVKTLIQRAQDAGFLTGISMSTFTTATDSNGVAWGQQANVVWSPGRKYLDVLADLADYALCEFEITPDRQLRLYRYGTRGVDRTTSVTPPLVLRRGQHLKQSPRTTSVREAGTDVLAAGKEGLYRRESNATALQKRGRRILRYASANGIEDAEALIGWAQAQLVESSAGRDERTHDLSFGRGDPLPIADYDLGDWVGTATGNPDVAFERERVMQWSFEENEHGEISGSVVTGTPFRDSVDRLRRRVAAIEGGSTVVGTSEPSGGQQDDTTPPAAPEGVLASSIAYQDPEHTQTLAVVTVGWEPVTTNAEGSHDPRVQAAELILERMQTANPQDPSTGVLEDWTWAGCPQVVRDYNDTLLALFEAEPGTPQAEQWLADFIDENTGTPTVTDDVAGYRVRYAYLGLAQVGGIPSSDPFPEDGRVYYEATPPGGTAQTSFSFGGIEGGSNLRIEVAAFDNSGNQSAWTAIGHDVTNDATPPPTPSTPTVRVVFRTLDVTWDGLGSVGESMPPDFSHVEVHVSQANNFNPVPEGTPGSTFAGRLYAGGTTNYTGMAYGIGYFARLVAVDNSGNRQPVPSATSAVATAEQLFPDDLRDSIINHPDKIAFQVVDTLHIKEAAIVGALIDVATIEQAHIATVNAGSIVSGTMTATVVIGGSFRTSASSTVNRLEFDAAGIRLYQGATQVGRWQVSDASMLVTGTYQSALAGERINIFPDGTLRFYPPSGTNYSQMSNFGNDVVWRGPLDGSNRSGRINANALGVGLNFSAESEIPNNLRSEFALFDRRIRATAPFINLEVSGKLSTPDGTERRVQFSKTNSSGSFISQSGISYFTDNGSYGGFAGNGAGWKFQANQMLVCGGDLENFNVIKASEFAVGSSQTIKDEIEDIRAILDPGARVKAARARKYIREQDKWYRPQPTPQNPNPEPVPVEDPPVSIGVIAEEMPEVVQQEGPDGRGGTELGVGLTAWVALLHGAINQLLDQEARSVIGRALVPNGAYQSGTEATVSITWDEAALEAPSDVTALALVGMPTAMGKVRARVVPGSVTTTGCQVRATFSATVAVTNALPIAVEAIGRYIWNPPYQPPESP